MPFTLAHPAAVLPLRRIPGLQTVPLMIGAITPDLPYFTPWRVGRWMVATHTLRGSVFTDIPLGMILLVLLFLLRRPLTELLGDRARPFALNALERFGCSPRAWLLAPFSIVLGAWTHLLWDSFTHPLGWMVLHVSLLSAEVSIGPYTGELCHILQYASSVAGLAVLALWYRRHAPPAPRATDRWPDRILLALVLMASVIIGCFWAVQPAHGKPVYVIMYFLITRSMAWFAMLYLAAGTLRMWSRRPEPQLGSASS
jgi:hypothetical protein